MIIDNQVAIVRSFLCALLTSIAIPNSFADQYTCVASNETRLISVEHEHKGWNLPCKVKYEKPSEDTVEYLWNSQFTSGYCEDKAAFLAKKLQNGGWACIHKSSEPEQS
jgi:hypothetical protein